MLRFIYYVVLFFRKLKEVSRNRKFHPPALPGLSPRPRAAMSEDRTLGKRPRGEDDSTRSLEGDSGDEEGPSTAAAGKDDGDSAMAAADADEAADEELLEENEDSGDVDDEDSGNVDDEEEGDELLRIGSKEE